MSIPSKESKFSTILLGRMGTLWTHQAKKAISLQRLFVLLFQEVVVSTTIPPQLHPTTFPHDEISDVSLQLEEDKFQL